MNKNFTVIIAGGDLRQIYLAKYLSAFFNVKTIGLNEDNLPTEKDKADILILPIIVSNDGVHLNAPFSKKPVSLSSLSSYVLPEGTVCSGKLSPEIKQIFTGAGLKTVDYFSREELIIKNCIPTAEGALQIAMEEIPTTVSGSKVLVIGYGRVGKAVSHLFSSVGATVFTAARKYSDLAWCETLGINGIKTEQAVEDLGKYDIIINTVPAVVLDRNALMTVSPEALIIDLASKPGGVDFDFSKELGLNVIWALSLPLNVKISNKRFSKKLSLSF